MKISAAAAAAFANRPTAAPVPMTFPTAYTDPPFHPNLLVAKLFASDVIEISQAIPRNRLKNFPLAWKFSVHLSNFPSA
jgi:hypothetical protein